MIWTSRTAFFLWPALATAVAIILSGCGSEVGPNVPAPPPFVPATSVVTLGVEGGATTLVSTQAGGWTHNGQPFSSGNTVRGQNAATYRLTLSGGTWSAEFVPPDPTRVHLGRSGDEVSLVMQEDGSYQIGTAAIQSGHVVTARNGNRYTLSLDPSGNWSAEFLVPDRLRIALGSSGDSVDIEQREDRNFWLGGSLLFSGREVSAANGNRYTLALGADGMWRAVFVQSSPQQVSLGSSGRSVLVNMLEDGTYLLDDRPLSNGEVRETAGGANYRFDLGADSWSATFVAEPETVRLGTHGGTVRLVRQENGIWTLGGRIIVSGHTVRGQNGHDYTLVLAGRTWESVPHPVTIQVDLQDSGGSIFLTRVEDGTLLYEGIQVRSGDSIQVRGSSYILRQLAGGSWRATLSTVRPPRPPGEPPTSDTLASYVGVTPRVLLTQAGSSSSRAGSTLEVNNLEYSVHSLFTSGSEFREVTFAEETRGLIADELDDIRTLIGLASSSRSFDSEIERRWDRISGHLNMIFPGEGSRLMGLNTPKRRSGRIDYDGVLEEVQDVLAALATSSNFRDAVDFGVFSRSRRVDVNNSHDTFYAVRSSTRLGFGWSSATRFGAYSKLERSAISRALHFPLGDAGIGAFAYSPLEPTRTRDLPRSGEAFYFGETVAASRESSQAIYTGDVELRVRFASRQVTALVSSLRDSAGRAWRYSFENVDTIRLPAARLHSSDGSFRPSYPTTARISLSTASPLASRVVSAEFDGRFVGRGQDAGRSAIGTWSLSRSGSVILTGGFGADHEARPAPPIPTVPPVDQSGDLGLNADTYLTARPDSNGNIRIAARDSDNNQIELSASELYSNRGAVVTGERLLQKTRDDLQGLLRLMDVYVNVLGATDPLALRNREALWRTANQTLQNNVFGVRNVLGATYPRPGSRLNSRDDEAIDLLRDAILALSSPTRFRQAVEGGGVFEDILNQSKLDRGDYDFEGIHAASDYEVSAKYESTDHARFGAWAKQDRTNALAPTTPASPRTERTGTFAYSRFGPTVYSRNDVNFPRGFASSYVGRTVAVDSSSSGPPKFYDGDVNLTVRWGSSGPSGSRVTTIIENLARIDNGAPLQDRGDDISHLVFTSATVRVDSRDRIEFNGTSSVRARFYDVSRSERYLRTGTTVGKFVGYDLAGPSGVIGTWNLGLLEGAFGAQLVP